MNRRRVTLSRKHIRCKVTDVRALPTTKGPAPMLPMCRLSLFVALVSLLASSISAQDDPLDRTADTATDSSPDSKKPQPSCGLQSGIIRVLHLPIMDWRTRYITAARLLNLSPCSRWRKSSVGTITTFGLSLASAHGRTSN